MTPYKLIIVFAILYMLVLLMKKDMVVTERGVETFYQMRITTWYEKLEWKDIDMVVREDRDDPRLVALYFRERDNDDRVKRLFFTREDAQNIMRMAKLQPNRIEVCEADKKSGPCTLMNCPPSPVRIIHHCLRKKAIITAKIRYYL